MNDVNEYQEEALRTATQGYGGLPPLVYCALGLAGEAGEFADHVKKVVRDGVPADIPSLVEELGDLAWYLVVAAHHLEHRADEVLRANVAKLRERYPEGYDAQRSLERPVRDDHPYVEAAGYSGGRYEVTEVVRGLTGGDPTLPVRDESLCSGNPSGECLYAVQISASGMLYGYVCIFCKAAWESDAVIVK